MQSSLVEAYRRTTFAADTPRGRLALRIGEASAELDSLLASLGVRSWAYVTAWNPGSVQRGDKENERRQRELVATVATCGLTAYAGEGIGNDGRWPSEPSLLILGIARVQAIELGRQFGQVAIVYGERGAPAELALCAKGD
jgi:hypothetical protein